MFFRCLFFYKDCISSFIKLPSSFYIIANGKFAVKSASPKTSTFSDEPLKITLIEAGKYEQ